MGKSVLMEGINRCVCSLIGAFNAFNGVGWVIDRWHLKLVLGGSVL